MNSERKRKFEEEKEQLLNEIFSTLSTLHRRKTGERGATFDLSCVTSMDSKANFLADCEKMDLKMPALVHFLESVAFSGIIRDLLGRKTEAIVHLYLLQGYDFASRDFGSASDPYVVITCGDHVVNQQDDYQSNEPNPRFN